ncbi:hypothetical protein D3C81_1675060 [compost metagenome]
MLLADFCIEFNTDDEGVFLSVSVAFREYRAFRLMYRKAHGVFKSIRLAAALLL